MNPEKTYHKDLVVLGLVAAGAISATFIIILAFLIFAIVEINSEESVITLSSLSETIKIILGLYIFSVILAIPTTLIVGSIAVALLTRWVSVKPFNCALTGGVLTPLPFLPWFHNGHSSEIAILASLAISGTAAGLTFWRIVRIKPADASAGLTAKTQ